MEEKKITSVLKAVRAKCLDCCCWQPNEVKLCPATQCPLYEFRFGKNPYRKKRVLSEEQLEKQREALKKARENRKDKSE